MRQRYTKPSWLVKKTLTLTSLVSSNGSKQNGIESPTWLIKNSGKLCQDNNDSVVTKGESMSVDSISRRDRRVFAERYSQDVDLMGKPLSRPIAYGCHCPTYLRLHDLSLEKVKQQYTVVQELVNKAAGPEIERFILPIGNDGMNSEGMRRTTTKGTPEKGGGWKDTFRGYWRLMTRVVNYLKEGPVDIIVVSAARPQTLFYAEVLELVQNDANVMRIMITVLEITNTARTAVDVYSSVIKRSRERHS